VSASTRPGVPAATSGMASPASASGFVVRRLPAYSLLIAGPADTRTRPCTLAGCGHCPCSAARPLPGRAARPIRSPLYGDHRPAWRRALRTPLSRGQLRTPVDLDHVSPALVQATLAGEDAAFYHHPGIDLTSVVRALWLNLKARQLAYGESTITQQLAKVLDRQPRRCSCVPSVTPVAGCKTNRTNRHPPPSR